MTGFKNRFQLLKKTPLQVIGVILLILIAVIMLLSSSFNSNQAMAPNAAQVCFMGEYRIEDGPWRTIVEGQHIPSTKGDVTLRGNFHLFTPSGQHVGLIESGIPIAFFTDHISVTVLADGNEPYVLDNENPLFGDSACGEAWIACSLGGASPVEILIHNPHCFGNETAIDSLLSSLAVWGNIDFEREILSDGEIQRNTGLLFAVFAIVLLGTALFSTLIHIKNGGIVFLLGLALFFAGGYMVYSSHGISIWSETIKFNTSALGISMMLCMFFILAIASSFLKTTKKTGVITTALLGAADAVFFILPLVTDLYFYDTWPFWVLAQSIANVILFVCLVKDFLSAKRSEKWIFAGAGAQMIAFEADAFLTYIGVWDGGVLSKYVFIILFIAAIVAVLRIIPHSINAAAKAKKLETEKAALDAQLAESRISTMMSQIRPHFIYNTLGSIEQLCELDPKKAGELVHNFAKYLRGNFGELDNPRPIRMSQEIEHVRHYISIENVRFPDMTFSFEMNSEDFSLPALTIQPIVENAIKHGLMKLQKGGSIRVTSYETDCHYCVSVEDDGIGFDTSILIDNREHVGIRNISERLKTMVNGTLEINSTPGTGTKVLIKIPKEEQK